MQSINITSRKYKKAKANRNIILRESLEHEKGNHNEVKNSLRQSSDNEEHHKDINENIINQ